MKTSEIIKRPIERVSGAVKKTAWMSILELMATLMMGILLIAWPEIMVKAVSYVFGIFFVVRGVYMIVNYFVSHGNRDFFNNDLLWGVISTLIGIAVFLAGEQISEVFRVAAGIWMIYKALVGANMALKLYTARVKVWNIAMVLALVMLALGIFVVANGGAVIVLVGWMLVLDGIISVIGDVILMTNLDAITKKITETIDKVFE